MKDGYKGIAMNLVMADEQSGDIGYVMLAPVPNRKNNYPLIGSRVLNGETTENDWDGYLSAANYPSAINPEKGYIVTCAQNNEPAFEIKHHIARDG